MKKQLLLVAIAAITFGSKSYSNGVNQQTAQTIAENFFKVTAPRAAANVSATLNMIKKESDNTVDFYVFNIAPGPGFVIVAADDNTTPVLGYSFEANFDANIQRTGLSDWMKNTSGNIYQSIQHNVQADTRIHSLWTAYAAGQNPVSQRAAVIGPLLTTTWDQEPNYNALCPYNTTDQQRCVTGCVATTMAQIMKYWSYPAHGTGSYSYNDAPPNYSGNYGTQSANFGTTTYNWTNMPAHISSANSDIATLMYQCGVSVAMDYGDDNQGGSGAWVLQSEAGNNQPCAQYSFIHYFSYNPNTIQGVIKSHYNATDWMNLMKAELNAGRVIQYEGDDASAGGHTWVCDGYDASDNLHMNWGWGGSANGYFAVTNLNAGGYNFSTNEAALIGIEPLSPINVVANAVNTTICPGTNTTLTAQGPAGATYTWTPATGLNCSTCASTDAAPNSTTLYTVTVDSAGVIGTASVTISISSAVHANFISQASASCSIPVNVSFTNSSTNATGYIWDFGDGVTSTQPAPVHSYTTYGSYTVSLMASNSCGQDSIIKTNVVVINDQSPVSAGQSICNSGTVTLSATGTGVLTWYNAATGGNSLGAGATFTTPTLNSSTTYYVNASIDQPVITSGPVNNIMGGGGYFTNTNQHTVIFNCTKPQTLISVDVYAQNAGNRTIQLQDSTGAVLQSATVNIPVGHSTVTLNMPVPAQDNLRLALAGNTYLYRNNSGPAYPYTSPDGSLVITGSDAGSSYYYYFYNWQLQQDACVTTRTAVPVTVLGTGTGTFNTTVQAANTVNFTTPDAGLTYAWSFGDGSSSSTQNPTHTYAAPGTYTVQLVESNGSCSETVTNTVTIAATGISAIGDLQSISLFPNPAKDVVTLSVATGRQLNNCNLTINNVLGAVVAKQQVSLSEGNNTLSLNVSSLAQGVYMVTLQNGKESVTKRFVKTN